MAYFVHHYLQWCNLLAISCTLLVMIHVGRCRRWWDDTRQRIGHKAQISSVETT